MDRRAWSYSQCFAVVATQQQGGPAQSSSSAVAETNVKLDVHIVRVELELFTAVEAHLVSWVYVSSRSRVYCASVTLRHNTLWTVLKRAYFMTVINGVFCLGRACDKQTRDAFQSVQRDG